MSAASDAKKPAHVGLAALLCVLGGYVGCSFPDHTFVDDSQFYAQGGAGAAGAGNGGTGNSGGTGATEGGTGATGATGGNPGGGGGGTGNENCTNGVDDDGDNFVDCADPDCQSGYTCVSSVPAGWTGPVALYDGSDTAPGCNASGGYPTQKLGANSGIDGGTAVCPTCTCTTPPTLACSANLVFFESSSCGVGSCWGSGAGCPGTTPNVATSACGPQAFCQLPGGVKPQGVIVTAVTADGSCTVGSTGTKQIPAPTWTNTVRACGDAPTAGGGCGSGVCVPAPPSPFEGSPCIYKTGDNSCPAAFPTKKLANQNFQDTRTCTACTCGAIGGATCSGGTVKFYTDDFCGVNEQAFTVGGCHALTPDPTPSAPLLQCNNLPADTRSAVLSGATLSGTGNCPPAGGSVSGAVLPIDPITFCCL